jgi:hypothetical protein
MIRKLIAKLTLLRAERVASVRHKRAVPIKLSFEPNKNAGKSDALPETAFITGETMDLSRSGLAFLVSSIRLKENYLVGGGRVLCAELDLPNGKVSMKIVGERYERVDEHIAPPRYFVGASIKEMTDENREAYDDFLRLSGKKGNTGSLKFGIDES